MDHILSVCTGIGGLDLGVHAALKKLGRPARTVCMVEREAFAVSVVAKAIQEGAMAPSPLWFGDLGSLPARELPRIDWYIGGYPCQPFSSAGKQQGESDPRHLWPVIRRQVAALRPRGLFFENVGNHWKIGADSVIGDMASMGYRVACGVYSAREVGAPHWRRRLFMLAIADGSLGFLIDERNMQHDKSFGRRMADADRRRLEELGKAHDEDRRNACGNDACRCGEDVADADSQGVERQSRDVSASEWEEEWEARLRVENGLFRGWPARPGDKQRAWEPPRVVESRLGGLPDGVPDRMDRLRALGNAVVPQQAEHAFLRLWRLLTDA